MKKVVCPSCHVVQEIDETIDEFVCQDCQKTGLTSQGEKIYNILYSQYSQLGNTSLNITKDFNRAQQNYERLLILDNTNLAAIFGLVEIKISLAKLNESVLGEVISSLETQIEHIFNENNDEFKIMSHYLNILSKYVDYYSEAKKLLTNNDVFINLAAKEKMISLVNDLILLHEYVQKILTTHYPNEEENLKQISDQIVLFENLLNQVEQAPVQSNDLILPTALLEKEVIGNKTKQYKLTFVLNLLQFALALGAIISLIVMSKQYQINPFPGLISAGVFIVLFVVNRFILKYLKKRF